MLLAQGTQLNNIGRHDDAVPLLSKAIAASPQAVEPRCELAYALLSLGRLQNALKEADAAASLDPQYERPHRLRSIILSRLDRPKDSLAAAEAAVRLAPDLPSGLYTLGSAQLRIKRNEAAERTAQSLIAIAPAWALSHILVGQVAVRRKQWKKAEEANRAALQIEPTNQIALNNLGVALQGQRRSKEALEIYQRAAQLDPDDPVAKANIVRMVQPISGAGVAWNIIRMVIVPWSIPIVLIQLTIQFIRSARRRGQLRPGARMYYDRTLAGSGFLTRLFLALFVLVLGYGAIALAQLLGWTFVTTGIPVMALVLLCIGIAFSGTIARLPAELGRRWRALRPSRHG
jgi:tetratricopeptide (TPR) repeat protein